MKKLLFSLVQALSVDLHCRVWTYVKACVCALLFHSSFCALATLEAISTMPSKMGRRRWLPMVCCLFGGLVALIGLPLARAQQPSTQEEIATALATAQMQEIATVFEYDTDRPGSDYRNFELAAADPALCASQCGREERCRAWTYVKPGVQGPKPRCWLKDRVPDPVRGATFAVSGVVPRVTQATWGTQANQLGGTAGQQFPLVCPGSGTISSRLWGTDLYTDDSSICTAAVHAGLISVGSGGTVTIELRPGANSYSGSTRYGVSSQNFGAWSGSFVFVGGGGPGSGGAGGICDDPRTLAIMDEWLARANPPENQRPGWSVRYEAWGRLVGRTPTNTITVSGPPDTPMTRCEWLWYYSPGLRSTNLGTLREYVERRRQ